MQGCSRAWRWMFGVIGTVAVTSLIMTTPCQANIHKKQKWVFKYKGPLHGGQIPAPPTFSFAPMAQPVAAPVMQPVAQPVAAPVMQPMMAPVFQPMMAPMVAQQVAVQPMMAPVAVQPMMAPVAVQPMISPVAPTFVPMAPQVSPQAPQVPQAPQSPSPQFVPPQASPQR